MLKKQNLVIVLIFILGIVLRFFAFAINPSLIYDDAALAMNIANKNYTDFLKGLEYCQVAPVFFLMISKLIYNIVPKNYEVIDISLKIIPLLSSIASIPLFYILSKYFFKDKFKLYIANSLFLLSPLLISLSGRFKQYSTEVMVALILYYITVKYLTTGTWKKYWYGIIIIAPWFSLSSLIILGSIIGIVFLKNKFIDKKILFSILFSILLFSVVYLPSNFHTNYSEMNRFWSQFAFLSITHPHKIFIRLGELFTNKHIILRAFLGSLVLYKMFEFAYSYKRNVSYYIVVIPILVTIILSSLHLYPFIDRCIAFLVPLFIVIISNSLSLRAFSKILSLSFVLISVLFSIITIYDISQLPNYRTSPEIHLNNPNIHKSYKPFHTVYKWYSHLN